MAGTQFTPGLGTKSELLRSLKRRVFARSFRFFTKSAAGVTAGEK
jgi:hypothetical protein